MSTKKAASARAKSTSSTSSKSKTASGKTGARTTKRLKAPVKTQPAAEPTVVSETAVDALAPLLRKRELINSVVERSGVRKKFAKPVVEAMIGVLGEALAEGRDLNLQPMGRIKQQRVKDTANARITIAKIRQNKAGDGLAEDSKTEVATAAE